MNEIIETEPIRLVIATSSLAFMLPEPTNAEPLDADSNRFRVPRSVGRSKAARSAPAPVPDPSVPDSKLSTAEFTVRRRAARPYSASSSASWQHLRVGFGRGRVVIEERHLEEYRRSVEVLPLPPDVGRDEPAPVRFGVLPPVRDYVGEWKRAFWPQTVLAGVANSHAESDGFFANPGVRPIWRYINHRSHPPLVRRRRTENSILSPSRSHLTWFVRC